MSQRSQAWKRWMSLVQQHTISNYKFISSRGAQTKPLKSRLRVASNFGDGDCFAGKIHTRAREISRRRDVRKAR